MSNVLETFFIEFVGNMKPLEDGADDATKKAGGMADAFEKAGDIGESVGAKFADMVKGAGALLASYLAFESFAAQAEEIAIIGRAAETLGESVEDVDAFGKASVAMGGDLQGAIDSLTDMSEALGEVVQDGESAKAAAFAAIGLSARDMNGNVKTATAGLLDLAEAAEKMTREEAIFRIKEIGITDNRTIDLLLKGRRAVEEMIKSRKELGTITQEDTDALKNFKMALGESGQSIGFLQTKLMTAILPALTDLVGGFNDAAEFLGKHKTAVVAFFAAVGAAVAVIYAPAMVTAAIATWAAIAPFVAIGALIAALAAAFALAAEDLWAFNSGQKSLIGDIAAKWPLVGDLVRVLINWWTLLWDVLKSVATFWADVWTDPAAAFDQLIDDLGSALADFIGSFAKLDVIAPAFRNAFGGVKEFVNGVLSDIAAFFGRSMDKIVEDLRGLKDRAVSAVEGAADSAWNSVKSTFSFGDDEDETAAAMGSANAAMAQVQAAAPLAAVPSQAIGGPRMTSQQSTVNVGDITINTQATDPQGVASAVNSTLEQQLRQTVNDFDDGVAA